MPHTHTHTHIHTHTHTQQTNNHVPAEFEPAIPELDLTATGIGDVII
jgi:hypothetical protein